jgi:hypothetical protein
VQNDNPERVNQINCKLEKEPIVLFVQSYWWHGIKVRRLHRVMGLHSSSPGHGLRDAYSTYMDGKTRTTPQKEFVVVSSSIGARIYTGKPIW